LLCREARAVMLFAGDFRTFRRVAISSRVICASSLIERGLLPGFFNERFEIRL
jgi:hypothetical protein